VTPHAGEERARRQRMTLQPRSVDVVPPHVIGGAGLFVGMRLSASAPLSLLANRLRCESGSLDEVASSSATVARVR